MKHIPEWLRCNDIPFEEYHEIPKALLAEVRKNLKRFHTEHPVVSILVYVEMGRSNLFSTLSSLTDRHCKTPTEMLFVCHENDRETIAILQQINADIIVTKSLSESEARQGALLQSKGDYILNADANSVYPPHWGRRLVEMLIKREAACAYGSLVCFSNLHFYGKLGALENWWQHRTHPQWQSEEVSIPSFNFAFRKADALTIFGGFDTQTADRPATRLAMELIKYGPVLKDLHPDSAVWHRMFMNKKQPFTIPA